MHIYPCGKLGPLKGTVNVISGDPSWKQCPIYNGFFIRSKMWKILSFFSLNKCFFLWVSPLLLKKKECGSHYHRELTNENKQFRETKSLISNSYFIRELAFKGTVVKRTFPSLLVGSVKIVLTVPLRRTFMWKDNTDRGFELSYKINFLHFSISIQGFSCNLLKLSPPLARHPSPLINPLEKLLIFLYTYILLKKHSSSKIIFSPSV